MQNTTRTRLPVLAAVYGIAIVLAATAAAAGLKLPGTAAAYAANHCTRYAPAISQDFNCNLKGTMTSSGYYQTPSTALRDLNVIDLNASRSWSIGYTGGNYGSATGTGTYGSIGSSGGYAAAWCAIVGSNVTGLCTTYWHN